ncbi:OmpA family protein [Methylocella silvestris]|uniref:OmpA family protein n=1 Tax=Methylocella silvestris TaxID=199596 RepID=UPI0015E0D9E6|nr:OmpA family protein [Methylocella silvestris]
MSAFELDAMFRALPDQTTIAPVTVSGFTQYKTHVSDLPASESAKIDAVADAIVTSYRAGRHPIIGVLIVGHADQDLSRGVAFEQEISIERAECVREALLSSLQSRTGAGLMPLQVKEAAVRTAGVGATQRVVTHPINEAQRAQNRRVVLYLAESITPVVPLDGFFPVPPQKVEDEEGAAPASPRPQRSPLLLAFSIPIFGSPALAGAAVFASGQPRRPSIKHDHGFLDDGKGNIDPSKRQSPTDTDRARKDVWKFLLGLTIQNKPELKDATDAYKHFLVDNNGTQLTVRYEGFVKDDANGKTVLKSAIDDTRTGVLDIFDSQFPKPLTSAARTLLQVTSSAVTVGRATPDFRYPYPADENWQKAIGGHALWISADAIIDSAPGKLRTVAITMTLHAEDMYNFNPDGADIATNTRDAENGRFEIVGLGTEFLQIGTAQRTITFTIPNAKQADNRVVPADQKVT